MRKSGLLFLIVSFISVQQVVGQFSVDGEFRSRSILSQGYKVPVKSTSDAVFSFDQRSRLNLNYKNDKYSTRLVLQDARVWGSDDRYNPTGVMGNSGTFGIYEAWVELKLKEKSSLRIGRQEWNYNNMRILSYRNWWTSGLSYDGLLYKLHDDENGWFIDLGLSYNNDGSLIGDVDNTTWTGEKLKTINFVNFKKKHHNIFSTSLFFSLAGRDYPDIDKFFPTGTHGLILDYNNEGTGFFGSLSGYYQHGTDSKKGPNGDYRNISAWLVSGELGVRAPEKNWELAAGAEVISGHDFSNTENDYANTRHSFDLLYSARFAYYGGNVNHFIMQDSYKTGTKGGGYFDPYLRFSFKPGKKNALDVTWWSPVLTTNVPAHTFIDEATGLPAGTETDNNGNTVYWKGGLGNYIDLGFTQRINPDIVLKTGFSFGTISDIKNQMVFGYKNTSDQELFEPGANYLGWVMLIVKPNFFTSE
ncbi:alginate export family protein [Tangfeifania diversioriginum]|uniref:alginate export family protein n=1 Tax=Tangfeifania diversioriginum TaxID=1168035 RepID=UPI00093282F8|nr:alginate export family protein [Tangfeifania diversioriginum]